MVIEKEGGQVLQLSELGKIAKHSKCQKIRHNPKKAQSAKKTIILKKVVNEKNKKMKLKV